MNRHEAYGVLSKVLERHRSRPYEELAELVGVPHSERTTGEDGGEYILDVAVGWADEREEQIKFTASVDSPSSFRLERVEGEILVSRGAV